MRRSNLSRANDPDVEEAAPSAAMFYEGPGADAVRGQPVRIGRTYAALLIIVLLGALDHTIVATALPTVVGELIGASHMAWSITAYALAMAVGMPIYGRLGDRFGRPMLKDALQSTRSSISPPASCL